MNPDAMMSSVGDCYMVIVTQIVGNPDEWRYSYRSDLQVFAERESAIRHGWGWLDHDDFNIGTVRDGRLVAFGWGMDDFEPDDRDDLVEVERQLGFPNALPVEEQK